MAKEYEFQGFHSGTIKVTDGTVLYSVRYTAKEKVFPGSYWHPEEHEFSVLSWDIDKFDLFDCITIDEDSENFDQELASAEARAREELEEYLSRYLEEIA